MAVEKQLLLKGIKTGFDFAFSTNANDLYIQGLTQSIDYGWEVPADEGSSIFSKPVTRVSFNKEKTTHEINLNGVIYIMSNLGTGLDNFTKLKNISNNGETFYLLDNEGNKLRGSGSGIWYVKGIEQTASDFVSSLNALKISFSITLNKYK